RPGAARIADQALALGQLVDHAERDRPLDFPRARIDGHELAPRRLVARRLRTLRTALFIVLTRKRGAEREERAFAVDARAVVRLIGAVGVEAVALGRFLALDPADQRSILCVDVDDTGRRVGCRAAPVDTAGAAGELDRRAWRSARRLEEEGRVDPVIEVAAGLVPHRAAGRGMLWRGILRVDDVVVGHRHAAERRRLDRDGLRRVVILAGHIARGNGAFLDRQVRLAGLAVDHEEQAGLVDRGDHRAAVDL